MTTEDKKDLILKIDAEILWLEGSRPITAEISRDILMFKAVKYLLEVA